MKPISEESKQKEVAIKARVMEAAKKDMHSLPLATRKFMEERMSKAFDSRITARKKNPATRFIGEEIIVTGSRNPRNIPERVIIADFYLPYICCSNGNNINIVLGSTEPEPIIADFEGSDFEENDFFTNDQ